jgi:hypothetical protein
MSFGGAFAAFVNGKGALLVVMLDVGEAEHLGSSVSALDCF